MTTGWGIDRRSWFAALLVFLSLFWLYTANNAFPWFYHPDAKSKVRQVLNGERNFHHPLLMVNTGSAFLSISGGALDKQHAAQAGRTASAVFAASTCAVLVLLAGGLVGPWGGALTGMVVGTHFRLFELAHYFKEDTALVFGLACAWLAIFVYHRRPSFLTALLVGAGVALAASGKYIGTTVLLPALVIIPAAGRIHLGKRFCGLLLGLVITYLAVNHQLVGRIDVLQLGLGKEIHEAMQGGKGLGHDIPHLEYLRYMLETQTTPIVYWPFIVFYLVGLVRSQQRRERLPEILLIGFFILFFVLLCFSAKASTRYFLPLLVLLGLFAGLGAARFIRWLPEHWPGALRRIAPAYRRGSTVAVVVLCFVLGHQKPLRHYAREFRHDTRQQLLAWIEGNLPPDARLLQSERVGLQHPDAWENPGPSQLSQDITDTKGLTLFDDAEAIRDAGFSHVVIAEAEYKKYFASDMNPGATERESYVRKKGFYEEFLASTARVWRSEGGKTKMRARVEIYEIR